MSSTTNDNFNRRRACALGGVFALLAFVATPASAQTFTGTYRANDGGIYYLRHLGAATTGTLFWYGERPDGAFANVFVGTLTSYPDSTLAVDDGRWWDVPKGTTTGASSATTPNSNLDLKLEGTQILKRNGSGVSFGATTWNRIVNTNPPRAALRLNGFTGEGATGVWYGNDGGVYYIRQSGPDFVWFGQACTGGATPSFANVFRGRRVGTAVSGQWADVPYGRATGSGSLSVNVVDANHIQTVATTGGFGGTSWTRASALAGAVASSLRLTITTGADDLRGGTVAYALVELSGGRVLPRVNLNNGATWGPSSTNTATIALPAGTTLRDVAAVVVEHDGAARNIGETYDNWDVVAVQVAAATSAGSRCLGSVSGSPFVRLTGETTFVRIPIGLM